MLKKIKYEMNKTGLELAYFLKVSEATIYNWEKKDNWPLWALKKCGVIKVSKGGEDAVL
jgi:DNA-binding XRE family transcriptional regulator